MKRAVRPMSRTPPADYVDDMELATIMDHPTYSPVAKRLAAVLHYERGVTKDRAKAEAEKLLERRDEGVEVLRRTLRSVEGEKNEWKGVAATRLREIRDFNADRQPEWEDMVRERDEARDERDEAEAKFAHIMPKEPCQYGGSSCVNIRSELQQYYVHRIEKQRGRAIKAEAELARYRGEDGNMMDLIAKLDKAERERDDALEKLERMGDCPHLASSQEAYQGRIKELEDQVKDLCEREDPDTAPIVRRLREELERDKTTIERQSLSLEVVNQELDAEQEMSARLRRVNEALAGIEERLDAEREMASAARTKAAQLQGIIDEKDRDNKALREALEARMMGKCDHEVRLVFHIGGDLHLQPIPEAKTTVSDMPPDGILLCRKDVNCAARFIGPAARDAHEALHSEDTIGFRCRQKDCTRSLASETALYNHEFSVHGFPKGGVPGAADLEAPKDSTPHGEATG